MVCPEPVQNYRFHIFHDIWAVVNDFSRVEKITEIKLIKELRVISDMRWNRGDVGQELK